MFFAAQRTAVCPSVQLLPESARIRAESSLLCSSLNVEMQLGSDKETAVQHSC